MTTQLETLKVALNDANPNKIADALNQIDLGNVLAATEYDTGTITAASAITLPNPGALLVQSVNVVAGTATGVRVVGDSSVTPAQYGTSGVYFCKLSADGKTITFEANVTRVIVRYIPKPTTDLTAAFNRE